MTLYSILTRAQHEDIGGIDASMEAACKARGIGYERLFTDEVVLDDIAGMNIAEGSLLYRMSTNDKARYIEAFLDTYHGDKLTTIYYPQVMTRPPYPRDLMRDFTRQIKDGLQIIPTAIVDASWLTLSADDVQERVNKLGGFPIVMKTLGMQHGRGVEKVDNLEELQHKFQERIDTYQLILRKYLADYRHYRLIVVDDAVVAAIEYHKPDDDFRTNAAETPNVSAVAVDDLTEEMRAIAIRSVQLRASLLGGADILVDLQSGQPLLAEVNIPCYYPRAEKPTGIDISGQIIDAMIRKKQKEHTA